MPGTFGRLPLLLAIFRFDWCLAPREPAVSWDLLATRAPAGGAWHLWEILIGLIRLIRLIRLIGLLCRVLLGFVDLGRRSKVNLSSIHQGLAEGRMRVNRFG